MWQSVNRISYKSEAKYSVITVVQVDGVYRYTTNPVIRYSSSAMWLLQVKQHTISLVFLMIINIRSYLLKCFFNF